MASGDRIQGLRAQILANAKIAFRINDCEIVVQDSGASVSAPQKQAILVSREIEGFQKAAWGMSNCTTVEVALESLLFVLGKVLSKCLLATGEDVEFLASEGGFAKEFLQESAGWGAGRTRYERTGRGRDW